MKRVRISHGKVNDFTHKLAGEEKTQKTGVEFIHVTESEAWKPTFGPIANVKDDQLHI